MSDQAPRSCALYLKIKSGKKPRTVYYLVVPVATDPQVANVAWRLVKEDGTQYTVHLDGRGVHCTCWDHIVRRENVEREGCKHCRALAAVGLLRALRVKREPSQ